MYVCIHVYMYICIYVYTCIHIYVYIYTYIHRADGRPVYVGPQHRQAAIYSAYICYVLCIHTCHKCTYFVHIVIFCIQRMTHTKMGMGAELFSCLHMCSRFACPSASKSFDTFATRANQTFDERYRKRPMHLLCLCPVIPC